MARDDSDEFAIGVKAILKPNVMNVIIDMPMLHTKREVMATIPKAYHHWNFK